jgi:TonB family protein
MKTQVILMLCMIFSVITMGQGTKEGATITPPKFTGIKGTFPDRNEHKVQSIEDYMLTNVTYPEEAANRYAMGTEVVAFSVTPEGKVSNIRVINSVHPSIDEEVISVLKTTNGMWKPGAFNDEAIAMDKEISVVFRFNERSASDNLNLAKYYYTRACKNLLVKQKPKMALKAFNNGVVLLPNDKSLLILRGLARFELGDKDGALDDWTRVKNLGGLVGEEFIDKYISLKGYEQMALVLGK